MASAAACVSSVLALYNIIIIIIRQKKRSIRPSACTSQNPLMKLYTTHKDDDENVGRRHSTTTRQTLAADEHRHKCVQRSVHTHAIRAPAIIANVSPPKSSRFSRVRRGHATRAHFGGTTDRRDPASRRQETSSICMYLVQHQHAMTMLRRRCCRCRRYYIIRIHQCRVCGAICVFNFSISSRSHRSPFPSTLERQSLN